jgi:hypothetical protein
MQGQLAMGVTTPWSFSAAADSEPLKRLLLSTLESHESIDIFEAEVAILQAFAT